MADTPNRPPLWEVMRDAYDRAPMPPPAFRNCDDIGRYLMAAEIRAIADEMVMRFDPWLAEHAEVAQWLRAEADRAERGDCDKTSTSADQ